MEEEQQLLFGPFRLDVSNEQLWRGNQEIRLQPKAFALLRFLVERPGQLVIKAGLLEVLWAEVYVTEAALAACIKDVRRALGDNPRKPRFIETVHRRGYRFIAVVRRAREEDCAVGAVTKERANSPSDSSTLQVLPDRPSIAVLPFDNMSGDRQQDYFADGIVEDIITQLSRFSDLFVIARNSTFVYKGKPVKVQEVGRDLGVQYVVQGSVRKVGDQVRVSVQLIDAATGNHVWADRYDRDVVDIFDLQDEVTQTIVATLPGRLETAQVSRLKRKPPDNMAAYDYLLAGKMHHHRNTKENNAEALRLLNKAIEIDPEFAQAYAWKACTLGQAAARGYTRNPEVAFAKSRDAIAKTLSLDENDVECHRILCEVNMSQREWTRAEFHHNTAYCLNPNDPRIVAQKGELLTRLGDATEGVRWIEKAMRLDPYGANEYGHLLGRALFASGRYTEAIDAFKQVPVLGCDNHANLAVCYSQLHLDAEAATHAAALLQLEPDFSIRKYLPTLKYKDTTYLERYREGLWKAGLPD